MHEAQINIQSIFEYEELLTLSRHIICIPHLYIAESDLKGMMHRVNLKSAKNGER